MRLLKIVFATGLLSLTAFSSAWAASFESDIESGDLKAHVIYTDHFAIEFSKVIRNQTDSDNDGIADVIELVAEAAEESWDIFIDDMDFERPTDSDTYFVIILDDTDSYLYPGSVGVASVFSNGDPYVAVDPWVSNGIIQVTVAHEFFHGIQFGYDLGFASTAQGIAFGESTAVWAEEVVYDDVDDYIGYLEDYFSYPDYSIFSAIVPSDSLFEYALSIWPIFLTEYYDEDLVFEIWETYADSDLDSGDHLKVYEAVKDAVEAEGDDLADAFQEFTLWNLETSQYSEGDEYPGVYALLDPAQGEYEEIESSYAPTLYGANYIQFENEDEEDQFYFHLVKADGVSYGVTLAPYDNGEVDLDEVVRTQIDADEDWDSEVSLDGLEDVDSVVVIVSPLERDFDALDDTDYVFDKAYSYYYFGEFVDDLDDLSEAAEIEVEDEAEEKEGEAASQDEDARDDNSLNFGIHDYDQDSVTFSWNRPNWSGLDGYELHYGTSSGDYDEVATVSQAYTTIKTVRNLEEGETYYFQLIGVDEDGDQVGEESSELVVTPEEWLFSDLSFLNKYYDSVAALVDEGIFSGYPDGSFQPDGDINRAELLKILMEGKGLSPSLSSNKNCFWDVGTDWYAPYVCYAKKEGWVKGFGDGSFRPANTVTKAEALKILFKVYEEELGEEGSFVGGINYTDVKPRAWYSVYVAYAAELGILEETLGSALEPNEERSRGQMAEQLYRYMVAVDLIERVD